MIRERLEQLRGQLLESAKDGLRVFTTTKDELRGWTHALEWILQGQPRYFYGRIESMYSSK